MSRGGEGGSSETGAAGKCVGGWGGTNEERRGLGWGRGGKRREGGTGGGGGEGAYDRLCHEYEELGACLHELKKRMPFRYRHSSGYKISKGAFLQKEGAGSGKRKREEEEEE